jgi:pimeloyl-ACP methyl ester carboxylesterase
MKCSNNELSEGHWRKERHVVAETSSDTCVVAVGPKKLEGILREPEGAIGLVIFAHGAGSSRLSPRNNYVAERLGARRIATLLFDLLTEGEALDRANVFDIPLLSGRMIEAVRWARWEPGSSGRAIGLFGASTGAAAALVAAARAPEDIAAVVSRGGRPDLAGAALAEVKAPTLLIVGGADYVVIDLNEQAARALRCEQRMEIVPGATHLFEEPGTLDKVVDLAADWFEAHLRPWGGAEK